MRTHNYKKFGRKHKHAKTALMQEINGGHYRTLRMRGMAQSFITVFAGALLVLALSSWLLGG